VSNERQHGGVEKKTPTNHPHPVGGGILKKEVCETKQITNARGLYCKPHTNGINLAQDVEKKKTEQRTPHFLSLDQDIVAVWIKVCNLHFQTNGRRVWQ
jgi:hypothetical protein